MAQTKLTGLERRAAIIDAAIRLFSEKGFRGTTTRELAAAVGVTEPVLYQHFSTKSELYSAILEEKAVAGERRIPDDFSQQLAAAGDDHVVLTALATGIVKWHTQDPAYIRLMMFSALENHEFHDIFYETYSKAFFAQLSRFFEQRMDEGIFRRVDPMLAAHTFLSLAAHYALGLTLFSSKPMLDLPPADVIRQFVTIFLEGMKNHDSK